MLGNMTQTGAMNRDFNGQLQVWLEDVDGYGCWGYFGDNYTRGKSQPVDELDEYFRDLHHGYECGTIDTLTLDNEICDTYSAEYTEVSPVGSDEEIKTNCESQNNGPNCASRACSVETKFVREIAQWQLSNFADNEFAHKNGFNTAERCLTTVGAFSERECCGVYPNRFPFRKTSASGDERRCCGSDLYFARDLLQCCADGSLKISC